VRHPAWIAAVVAAVVAAATAITVTILSTTDEPPAVKRLPSPAPTTDLPPPTIATSNGPFSAGPVAPPPAGAYLGAWVRPVTLTQSGRMEAITTWEAALGRRLDIINTYRRLDENFFNASDAAFAARGSTLMLSWAGGDTRSITMGRHDDLIRERARETKAFGHPVLLRYRWEMDRPGLRASMWSPEDYIAAWKHVRAVFTAEGVVNASWVWCPTAEGFNGGYAQPFYPGDGQVDWVCVDVYAGSKLRPIAELAEGFLRFAAAHPTKPAMIGEFGVARAWGADQRALWLRDAAEVFKANPQIRAVMYFESDPTDNKGATQQFQLSNDPQALSAFRTLSRDPHFNPLSR
jgi:hypothetical protein